MLIEIDMADVYRSLGAGRRIVEYVGVKKGRLHCKNMAGNHVRVPVDRFRFVRAIGQETRLTQSGRVEVKVGEEWQDLGPVCGNGRK